MFSTLCSRSTLLRLTLTLLAAYSTSHSVLQAQIVNTSVPSSFCQSWELILHNRPSSSVCFFPAMVVQPAVENHDPASANDAILIEDIANNVNSRQPAILEDMPADRELRAKLEDVLSKLDLSAYRLPTLSEFKQLVSRSNPFVAADRSMADNVPTFEDFLQAEDDSPEVSTTVEHAPSPEENADFSFEDYSSYENLNPALLINEEELELNQESQQEKLIVKGEPSVAAKIDTDEPVQRSILVRRSTQSDAGSNNKKTSSMVLVDQTTINKYRRQFVKLSEHFQRHAKKLAAEKNRNKQIHDEKLRNAKRELTTNTHEILKVTSGVLANVGNLATSLSQKIDDFSNRNVLVKKDSQKLR